jgi:uncharacterized protein YjbI with pentapeptide repeats
MEVTNKKINISVPNLDQTGYGIDGQLTRKAWQEECFQILFVGESAFRIWHDKLMQDLVPCTSAFEWEVNYADTSKSSFSMAVEKNPSNLIFDVSNCVFEEDLVLDGYYFRFPALFNGAIFKGKVSFNNSTFAQDAYFLGTTFTQDLSFSAVNFNNNVYFDYSVLGEVEFLGDTKVMELASFKHAEFQSEVSLQKLVFNTAIFDGAVFNKSADFTSGKADHGSTEYLNFKRISFSGTNFKDRVDFSNREFKGRTSFEVFEGKPTCFDMAPLFHNCKLHQDTTFIDAVFPSPSETDTAAARAYNTLRHAMSQQQATREEQRFLILELDAERLMAKKGVSRLYWLYKKLANYGFSVAKPLFFLVFLPFVFAAISYGVLTSMVHCSSIFSQTCQFDSDLSGKTIMFSMLQSLPPLGLDKLSEPLNKVLFGTLPDCKLTEHAEILAAMMVLQKVLSLAGWFFVALALRNLFKMK